MTSALFTYIYIYIYGFHLRSIGVAGERGTYYFLPTTSTEREREVSMWMWMWMWLWSVTSLPLSVNSIRGKYICSPKNESTFDDPERKAVYIANHKARALPCGLGVMPNMTKTNVIYVSYTTIFFMSLF